MDKNKIELDTIEIHKPKGKDEEMLDRFMDYMDFLDFKSSEKAKRNLEIEKAIEEDKALSREDKNKKLEQVKELYIDTAKDIDAKRDKILRPLSVMKDADESEKHTGKYLDDKDNIIADLKENKEDAAYRRALDDILGKVRKINDKLNEE